MAETTDQPGLIGPIGPGFLGTTGVTAVPLEPEASVHDAWNNWMRRVGVLNPKQLQQGGHALDAVEALMRR